MEKQIESGIYHPSIRELAEQYSDSSQSLSKEEAKNEKDIESSIDDAEFDPGCNEHLQSEKNGGMSNSQSGNISD